jgi:cytochrome c553
MSGPMRGAYGGPPGGYPSAPPGNAARGRQLAAVKCAACHGPDSNSTIPQSPKLAGQNPDYLYSQLLAFRSGARTSEVMAPVAAGLSEADAADLVLFYSEKPIRPDPVTNQALAQEGETIFAERSSPGAPPCAMCHSANGGRMPMMGMMGSIGPIPNLYGQHAAYTVDQLNRYASGARPDGVMNNIAAALSESQRKAVAEYLVGLQ